MGGHRARLREKENFFPLYTLFTNGRQPGTSARPNIESRRFRIKVCFRANLSQLTGQLALKLSVI